jgi:alkanesulfonate monooxygenase SsuD/methylene tetrahydromethanopterin reductase-like flavin-dependent oxidoreductase (luciferase family)
MRLGYFAMPLHPPGADPARTLDDDLGQLAMLDRLGYEEAWIGEHFTAQWENIPCPDLFSARALGVTNLCDNIWLVGSTETVAAKVAALGEAVGGFGMLLVIAHEWQPPAAWERSMTLLKEQVLPRLEAGR